MTQKQFDLLGLVSSFVRGTHCSVSSGANYFSLTRKVDGEYSAQWPLNCKCFQSVLWQEAPSLILHKYWISFFNLSQGFFPSGLR